MRSQKSETAKPFFRFRLFRRVHGFTLVETMVALSVAAATMAAFFVSAGQAMRILRIGRETALASQLLQQRSETFHATNLWSNITTIKGFTTILARIPPPAEFASATETYSVSAYPPDGNSFTVTRSPGGSISTSGASLSSTQRCVKLTGQLTWTGAGKLPRKRIQATILAKGGT